MITPRNHTQKMIFALLSLLAVSVLALETKTTLDGLDVGTPRNFNVSGWDVENMTVTIDGESFSAVVNFYNLCGDADGDGDPGRSSLNLVTAGGVDVPDLGNSESLLFRFTIGATKFAFGMTNGLAPRFFADHDATTSATPSVSAVSSSCRGTQATFAFTGWSSVLRQFGVGSVPMSLGLMFFSGSFQDDGVGEDWTPNFGLVSFTLDANLFGATVPITTTTTRPPFMPPTPPATPLRTPIPTPMPRPPPTPFVPPTPSPTTSPTPLSSAPTPIPIAPTPPTPPPTPVTPTPPTPPPIAVTTGPPTPPGSPAPTPITSSPTPSPVGPTTTTSTTSSEATTATCAPIVAASCERVDDDVCVTPNAAQTNECRTFRCGGSGAHFFACCNNCDEPESDPCAPRPTYQRTSAVPGNYCGKCGAPLASTCGEETSYTCGGSTNQNQVASACNAQIDAATPDTAFCWLFTDCFEAACGNRPFDLPGAVRNGTAICNSAVIGNDRRKRATGMFEESLKLALASALNVSAETIAYVRVAASNGDQQVVSFAFVETPQLRAGNVTVAQLATTFREDAAVKVALAKASIAPVPTYTQFVAQVKRVTPTTTTTTLLTKTGAPLTTPLLDSTTLVVDAATELALSSIATIVMLIALL
jgi:hypothetical protein